MLKKSAALAFALISMPAMATAGDVPPAGRGPMNHPGMERGRPGPGGGDMFDRVDANHDGFISRAEFDQARARMMERRMERRDGGPGMGGMHDGPPGVPPRR